MTVIVPQFKVTFAYEVGRTYSWIVCGEEQVEVLSKILRWNGVYAYSVTPFEPGKDDDPRAANSQARGDDG